MYFLELPCNLQIELPFVEFFPGYKPFNCNGYSEIYQLTTFSKYFKAVSTLVYITYPLFTNKA